VRLAVELCPLPLVSGFLLQKGPNGERRDPTPRGPPHAGTVGIPGELRKGNVNPVLSLHLARIAGGRLFLGLTENCSRAGGSAENAHCSHPLLWGEEGEA
jgi:hypothetical protein